MSHHTSPVGASVAETIRKKERGSASYSAKRAALEPFEQLARFVIMRRAELGISQEELAKRMGTTASSISRIESGQRRTRPETLKRLAEALNGHAVIGFVFDDTKQREPDLVTL